jgi:hypothetical protein
MYLFLLCQELQRQVTVKDEPLSFGRNTNSSANNNPDKGSSRKQQSETLKRIIYAYLSIRIYLNFRTDLGLGG